MEIDSPKGALDKALEKDEVGLYIYVVSYSTVMAKKVPD